MNENVEKCLIGMDQSLRRIDTSLQIIAKAAAVLSNPPLVYDEDIGAGVCVGPFAVLERIANSLELLAIK